MYGGMITLAYTTYFNWKNILFKYRLMILFLFILTITYKDILDITGINIPIIQKSENIYDKAVDTIITTILNYKK